jgi:hypothetical protein
MTSKHLLEVPAVAYLLSLNRPVRRTVSSAGILVRKHVPVPPYCVNVAIAASKDIPNPDFFGVALKNIEQALTDGQQSESGPGKKDGSHKRLVSQRGKRPRLKVADFSDELIERLPFRCNFPT